MGSLFGLTTDPADGQSPSATPVRSKLNHLREALGILLNLADDSANMSIKDGVTDLPGDLKWTARPTATRTGYLPCDGGAYSRASFAALFAAIGTTYGAGDGSTTFNVPPNGRFAFPYTGGSVVGTTGGETTHTLTVAELPSHGHALQPGTESIGSSGSGASEGYAGAANNNVRGNSTQSTGSGIPMNNMPPYIVYRLWIKT